MTFKDTWHLVLMVERQRLLELVSLTMISVWASRLRIVAIADWIMFPIITILAVDYTWEGGSKRDSSLILANDEYLCEVRTRQGEIIDQVTFCTNKRSVSFGGMDETLIKGMFPTPQRTLPSELWHLLESARTQRSISKDWNYIYSSQLGDHWRLCSTPWKFWTRSQERRCRLARTDECECMCFSSCTFIPIIVNVVTDQV